MRNSLSILTVIGVIALPSVANGQSTRPPLATGSCIDSTQKADSGLVVRQAIQAIHHSGAVTDSLKVAEFHVIKDQWQQEGIIVGLVPVNPRTRGGGGLVWVDSETYCAIVLRLYQ